MIPAVRDALRRAISIGRVRSSKVQKREQKRESKQAQEEACGVPELRTKIGNLRKQIRTRNAKIEALQARLETLQAQQDVILCERADILRQRAEYQHYHGVMRSVAKALVEASGHSVIEATCRVVVKHIEGHSLTPEQAVKLTRSMREFLT